jgi:hypothetical protein
MKHADVKPKAHAPEPAPSDRVVFAVNTFDGQKPGIRLFIDPSKIDSLGDCRITVDVAESIGQRLIAAAKEVRIALAKATGGAA